MPTFRQKADGNYIIVGFFQNSPCTWQVTTAGVEELQRRRFYAPGTVPIAVVSDLKARGLIFTHGSGITPFWNHPPETVLKQTTVPLPKIPSSDLAFRETDGGWSLALRIPQLPGIWRDDPNFLPTMLAKAVIIINGAYRLSAARLASGDIEVDEGIEPQERTYTIAAADEWPLAWKLTDWCHPAASISPTGELFDGGDGLRLKPGAALEPGGAYYFLTAPALMRVDRNVLPIPSSITRFSLGARGGWRAWRIHIPFEADEEIRAWCEHLGYRLAISRWKQVIVTPPQGFSPAGLPIFNVGQEVIVALLPPQNAPDPVRSTIRYRMYTLPAPGTYTISDPDDSASPVLLIVTPCQLPPDLAAKPSLLRLQILSTGDMHEFTGLFERRDSIQVTLPPSDTTDAQVNVSCAVPIRASLVTGQSQIHHERLTAVETSNILTDALRTNLADNRMLTMYLDAGAFGSLRLEVCLLKTVQSPATAELVLQLRWLATLLPALARQANACPLPSTILSALTLLSRHPGFEQLAHVRSAPPELLPRLWHIAKSIRPK